MKAFESLMLEDIIVMQIRDMMGCGVVYAPSSGQRLNCKCYPVN